jgi:hypothetical protein
MVLEGVGACLDHVMWRFPWTVIGLAFVQYLFSNFAIDLLLYLGLFSIICKKLFSFRDLPESFRLELRRDGILLTVASKVSVLI